MYNKKENVLLSDILVGIFSRNSYAVTGLYLEKGRLIDRFDFYPGCTLTDHGYELAYTKGANFTVMYELRSRHHDIWPKDMIKLFGGEDKYVHNEYVNMRRYISDEIFRKIQQNLSIDDVVTIKEFYNKLELDVEIIQFYLLAYEPDREVMEKKYGNAYIDKDSFYGFTDSFVYETMTVTFPEILKKMREKGEGIYMDPFWKGVKDPGFTFNVLSGYRSTPRLLACGDVLGH